ncbi:MAG: NAD-dependent epimerase/dehydratase family protein [Bdellovibrionales bacterium]|nr:NAD-dependent epimerase/dehydratase family protein [Bdellovibrionales bacterium]
MKSLPLPPKQKILVTGCAGFIGSHLLEALLELGHKVVGLDNLSSGRQFNLDSVQSRYPEAFAENFKFIKGDIRDFATCTEAAQGVDAIIHLAALGSVPRSIENPRNSIDANINGFFNILEAARSGGVERVVFASSSSIYGDDPNLPKKDGQYGRVLSPYAASKRTNELLAEAFANCYNMKVVGLRFFNVFGERQNPEGPYAAVIPKWTIALLSQQPCYIFGDGETSRDFTYVKNVIYGLLLAVSAESQAAFGRTLNLACGDSTTLNLLFQQLKAALSSNLDAPLSTEASYKDFRLGDIRHSHADISQAMELIGYKPLYDVKEGLEICAPDFVKNYV